MTSTSTDGTSTDATTTEGWAAPSLGSGGAHPPVLASTPEGEALWGGLRRPLPQWYADARFGIFVHWGAYSVPAWAEPSGALGEVPDEEWFVHNAYAEWYANTIRLAGSPAARHHRDVHGGRPYDAFLAEWRAEDFHPAAWASLFAAAGAEYVVPTTKHHDGIALWDAPGTGTRNTVHAGPRRDLVGDVAAAVRAAGLRFGVYYSGGLDWSVTDLPPHAGHGDVHGHRPLDAAYNAYALLHVQDLVRRYAPDVLWNDIEWPDAGKRRGPWSLHQLFTDFYAGNPDGVVNDRWGDTHHDFRTSEYSFHLDSEDDGAWEHCRGLGLSFGYNRVEDERQTLTGGALARHVVDVVSRGGRALVNVGPTASGVIPDVQRRALEGLAAWQAETALDGVGLLRAADPAPGAPSGREGGSPEDGAWLRWLTTRGGQRVALAGSAGRTALPGVPRDLAGARVLGGRGRLVEDGDGLAVEVASAQEGPVAVVLPR